MMRVMIVDDDETIRRLLRVTLPEHGAEIVEARDGQEALDLTGDTVPDLVLLDWNMPKRSGGEVLATLKRWRPDVKVIVLTADHRAEFRAEAEGLGVDLFLTKPFSPLELLAAIEELLPDI